MRRSAALVLLSSSLLALAGCKSPCRELSERRCDCVEAYQRETCVRAVVIAEGNVEPTEEQFEACEQKLDTCVAPGKREQDEERERKRFCEFLETEQGKQACGLAREP
jgi:hypothetical protein